MELTTAPPGAMGFAGTIHLYSFNDGALNASRISFLDQEELFWEAATWFEDYSDNNREYLSAYYRHNVDPKLKPRDGSESIYDYLYGGMGNKIFVRKDVKVALKDGYINLSVGKYTFEIKTSVDGIYDFLLEFHFFN